MLGFLGGSNCRAYDNLRISARSLALRCFSCPTSFASLPASVSVFSLLPAAPPPQATIIHSGRTVGKPVAWVLVFLSLLLPITFLPTHRTPVWVSDFPHGDFRDVVRFGGCARPGRRIVLIWIYLAAVYSRRMRSTVQSAYSTVMQRQECAPSKYLSPRRVFRGLLFN